MILLFIRKSSLIKLPFRKGPSGEGVWQCRKEHWKLGTSWVTLGKLITFGETVSTDETEVSYLVKWII